MFTRRHRSCGCSKTPSARPQPGPIAAVRAAGPARDSADQRLGQSRPSKCCHSVSIHVMNHLTESNEGRRGSSKTAASAVIMPTSGGHSHGRSHCFVAVLLVLCALPPLTGGSPASRRKFGGTVGVRPPPARLKCVSTLAPG